MWRRAERHSPRHGTLCSTLVPVRNSLSTAPRPIYPWGNPPWIGGWVGPRSDPDAVKRGISSPSRGSNTGRPARSPSLYRLLHLRGSNVSGPDHWAKDCRIRVKRAIVNSASSSLPQCTFPLLLILPPSLRPANRTKARSKNVAST
jgi:hypothetical protein